MNMKDVLIRLPRNEEYRTSLESLEPEAEEGMKRVDVEIDLDEHEVHIQAEDTSALRAALNSYLRWLDVSQKVFRKLN